MTKRAPSAQIWVTDGNRGMLPVTDRRFPESDLPVLSEIPPEKADDWFSWMRVECDNRGWIWQGLWQLNPDENSGSYTIHTGTPGQAAQITLFWERSRSGPLRIRARGEPPSSDLSQEHIESFVRRITETCLSGKTQRFYRRAFLFYRGLVWGGELWLDDGLRLGPPSRPRQPWALIAPQVLVVDALIDAIDHMDANGKVLTKLRELALFLSVILGRAFRIPKPEQAWVMSADGKGSSECDVRSLGYYEKECPQVMPVRGSGRSVLIEEVPRPDMRLVGIRVGENELKVPADIVKLWDIYRRLSDERRDQFLRVAHAWQLALHLGDEHETSSVAFMVVACESLKPPGERYDGYDVYKVVKNPLGKQVARSLRQLRFAPQDTRSRHFHRGELYGNELLHQTLFMASFQDPSFSEAHQSLSRIVQAAIVEWLLRDGSILP